MLKKYWIYFGFLLLSCGGTDRSVEEEEWTQEKTSGKPLAEDLHFMPKLRMGDVVFVRCKSDLSLPISLATHSHYTHCGMFYQAEGGNPFVVEASDTSRVMPAHDFFENTEGSSILVLRLKTQKEGLAGANAEKLKTGMKNWLGLPYDGWFMWDDEKVYCSELVYKLYAMLDIELCPIKTIGDFDLSSPEVKAELEKRYNGEIPYEEPVVAPVDIAHSNLMDTIYYVK